MSEFDLEAAIARDKELLEWARTELQNAPLTLRGGRNRFVAARYDDLRNTLYQLFAHGVLWGRENTNPRRKFRDEAIELIDEKLKELGIERT